MQDKQFIENVIRINPDIIYSSTSKKAIQTSEKFIEIYNKYT
jgi:broad specificity phosphatase PhoE